MLLLLLMALLLAHHLAQSVQSVSVLRRGIVAAVVQRVRHLGRVLLRGLVQHKADAARLVRRRRRVRMLHVLGRRRVVLRLRILGDVLPTGVHPGVVRHVAVTGRSHLLLLLLLQHWHWHRIRGSPGASRRRRRLVLLLLLLRRVRRWSAVVRVVRVEVGLLRLLLLLLLLVGNVVLLRLVGARVQVELGLVLLLRRWLLLLLLRGRLGGQRLRPVFQDVVDVLLPGRKPLDVRLQVF
jgi:hypothetical protein